MVVGYSLGNREGQEKDVQVLGEEAADVITYSKALPIVVSRICDNNCPYCGFSRNDKITIPYSTIKVAKKARTAGIREALFLAGERPDRNSHVRGLLDLWGFESYLDYLYTICELAFLEGLIPVIDIGFISPIEMKKMSEICASIKVMFDIVPSRGNNSVSSGKVGKNSDRKKKLLEWAGKMNFPITTGLLVGIGETKAYRREILKLIAQVHSKYGTVQEVTIQNFVPEPGTEFGRKEGPSQETMLQTVAMAKDILQPDIILNVPLNLNQDIESFIEAGIRDLGRIFLEEENSYLTRGGVDWNKTVEIVERMGFRLQQRFPLSKNFIKEGRYSKKLGQVFESYRYKIKKEEQEKLKAEGEALGKERS